MTVTKVWGGAAASIIAALFVVLGLSMTASAAPVVPLLNEGFESSGVLTGWVKSGGINNWTESNPLNLPLFNNLLTRHTGAKSAVVGLNTGGADSITLATSTVGYGSITLDYYYRVALPLGSNDHVRAQYSTDGSTWVTLKDYSGSTPNVSWKHDTFVLPAAASDNPNFKLRFEANFVGFGVDAFRLDDITLTGEAAPDCELGNSTFDEMNLGSVGGQGAPAWTGANGGAINASYDQEVVTNVYYPTFGCKSLRVSNSVTSGAFDWIYSPSVANEAGESVAVNSGLSGGTRQNHFEAEFDLGSVWPDAQQPGLQVSVSPDRGDGARMSYLRFVDQEDGIHAYFNEYVNGAFVETDIATLERDEAHTIKFDMTFVDGPANDIVEIFIDNNSEIVGTSWEDFFRDNQPGIAPPTVDSLLIQARNNQGGNVPANDEKGFLFDNFDLSSETIPGSIHITKYECPAGTTVNRTDNGVGGDIPAGCDLMEDAEFGYVHGSQINAGSPYPEFDSSATIVVGGETDNDGELTIDDLAATGRYAVFELNGDGQKLADSEIIGLYCEGDEDPTPTHNDNGDLTFVAPGKTAECIAYNQKKIEAPELLGWNVESVAEGLETDPITLDCSEGDVIVNNEQNSLNQRWTTVAGPNIKYIRQVNGNILSSMVFTGPSMNGWFSFGSGEEGTYETRVMAFNDNNDNNIADDGALNVSEWSNACTISFDTTAPAMPIHVSPEDNTTRTTVGLSKIDWTTVTDPSEPVTYLYQSSNSSAVNSDGSFVTLAYGSGSLNESEIPTPGTPEGEYYWHVRAVDAAGNMSPWTTPWRITIDNNEAPLPATPGVTTNAATGVTASNATLNALNSNVDAQGHSFWVSTTSPIDTSSPVIPVGVYSTPDMGAVGADQNFSASLSVVTTSGVPGNMMAIEPNTTYYFVAWVNVGGTWYPGNTMSLTTTDGTLAPSPSISTEEASDVTTTDATLNAKLGLVAADAASFWVSTTTFDTSTPNIPANVYSTPVLPGVAAEGSFSSLLSVVTTDGIITGGVPANMPAVTPNTTYYYAGWGSIGGTWYPGEVRTLTTASDTPTDTTAPTVVLSATTTDPTSQSPIFVTATFSESVSGFTVEDVVPSNATISDFTQVSPTVWTLLLTPTDSAVSATIAAHTFADMSSNENEVGGSISFNYQVEVVQPEPEPEAPVVSRRSGGGSVRRVTPTVNTVGEVLGTQTGPAECSEKPLLVTYMRLGAQNDSAEVMLLQNFLNTEMGTTLAVSGIFDAATDTAVKQFQTKYAQEILSPWSLSGPTGWVYLLTQWKINDIVCPGVAPKPGVTPFAPLGISGTTTAAPALGSVVLPTTTIDENAVGGMGDASKAASASTTPGWFGSFVGWLFGK